MRLPINKRLLTVQEYNQMAKVGILTKDDQVELIRGGSFYADTKIIERDDELTLSTFGLKIKAKDLIG